MSRKLLLLMLLALLIGTLNLASRVEKVEASGTIYIRADGSIGPLTALISTVDNVTYTLTGNITSDTDGIVIERNNIVVDGAGYTVQGNGSGTGIDLSNRNNVTIKNTTIKRFYYGIYLSSSSNNTFSGNDITNNTGPPGTFGYWGGIGLFGSSDNNSISGNKITANNGYGIGLFSSSNYNSISGNNITANNWYGIWLFGSSNSTISGNNIANNGYGIGFVFSNSSISGNNITANKGDGIELDSSSNYNSISGNNITANNRYGIELLGSGNSSISGNTFINDGLLVQSYYQNSVENNTVNGRPLVYLEGVSNYTVDDAGQVILVRCENIRVEGLNLSGTDVGVILWQTNNSSISGNNIANNGYGIRLDSSSDNMFYHNNFVANAQQVNSVSSANVWDDGYPSGGNYWSDYDGTDLLNGTYRNETGSDGIGDAEYAIDGNNTDHYPLMVPISFFDAGTWNDTTYYVHIVSNSTLSHFHFNPDEGAFASFWVKGETETEALGFCRVAIPKDLLWVEDGWTVLYGSYPLSYTTFSDENYTYLYFTYTNPSSNGFTSFTTVTINGTHVIPEFPSILVLPLFMIATLLAVIVYRRRKVRCEAKISGTP